MKYSIFVTLLVLTSLMAVQCTEQNSGQENEMELTQEEILNESEEAFDQRMEWWRDATFGMFIHWGPYAVPAGVYNGKNIEGIGEWIMDRAEIPVEEYEQYARQFNPVKYDAEEWVKTAKDAGMKYIIITSKHHDGFGLWDSEVSDYDAVDFAAIQKDLLAELKKACEKHDMKLGFYYSIMDWHHPNAQAPHYPDYNTDEKENPNFDQYVENYLKPQVRELVNKFDPAVLWFDGEWIPEWTHDHGVEMYTMLRQMKPDLIINNRVDVGRQGMQGMNKEGGQFVGDFGTPEQEILESTSDFDWEACMTMNDTWGYKKNDDNWKSAETLIHNLVDVAAKGGNYLLNVGPTAEGLIPQASVERLAAMGDWMAVNGEAIYETERLQSGFKEGESIRYTKKKGQPVYYGFYLEQPGEAINFSSLQPDENSEVHLLGYDKPLEWKFSEDNGLIVHVPEEARNSSAFGPAWTFKVRGSEISR
ncbi:alpha-L-fucosidase [Aliifodinibius sp. S!AR15-10]|uniref:alpha-L-fucosidase n=1 Tax=Aliifodinibius sp. S!AR15-10 TaxID=2950437 RepID=UPI002859A71A|nr:alpha-L-fucosidase [Aliifodinibius sp. S!AR15-10]MDR8392717.1 alpha-L-fucosidase [Aliifodinibius sp. S!AR15-10]